MINLLNYYQFTLIYIVFQEVNSILQRMLGTSTHLETTKNMMNTIMMTNIMMKPKITINSNNILSNHIDHQMH